MPSHAQLVRWARHAEDVVGATMAVMVGAPYCLALPILCGGAMVAWQDVLGPWGLGAMGVLLAVLVVAEGALMLRVGRLVSARIHDPVVQALTGHEVLAVALARATPRGPWAWRRLRAAFWALHLPGVLLLAVGTEAIAPEDANWAFTLLLPPLCAAGFIYAGQLYLLLTIHLLSDLEELVDRAWSWRGHMMIGVLILGQLIGLLQRHGSG